jgi:hypothetical protein
MELLIESTGRVGNRCKEPLGCRGRQPTGSGREVQDSVKRIIRLTDDKISNLLVEIGAATERVVNPITRTGGDWIEEKELN